MGTFSARLTGAQQKEKEDAARLEQDYGCKTTPFGQGQLTDEFRGYLREHPTPLPIRWLGDLLAARPDLCAIRAPESKWIVDSKFGRQDTQYWDLEKAAHDAHRMQQDALGIPHVYIWPDGISCSYVDDLPDEKLIPGPYLGKGSGTPYWLVPKELTRPLKEVFGKKLVDPFEDEASA